MNQLLGNYSLLPQGLPGHVRNLARRGASGFVDADLPGERAGDQHHRQLRRQGRGREVHGVLRPALRRALVVADVQGPHPSADAEDREHGAELDLDDNTNNNRNSKHVKTNSTNTTNNLHSGLITM